MSEPNPEHILIPEEAAAVLRCKADDPAMLALLPGIDEYLRQATGRDWAADGQVSELAKNAARILLVRWYEDPGAMATSDGALGPGLKACVIQLKALALQLAEEEAEEVSA